MMQKQKCLPPLKLKKLSKVDIKAIRAFQVDQRFKAVNAQVAHPKYSEKQDHQVLVQMDNK